MQNQKFDAAQKATQLTLPVTLKKYILHFGNYSDKVVSWFRLPFIQPGQTKYAEKKDLVVVRIFFYVDACPCLYLALAGSSSTLL